MSFSSSAALPTNERLPASEDAPLDVLSSEPSGVFIPTFGDFKDQLLFAWDGSALTIVDLETWDLYSTQPDTFPGTIADVKLLGDGLTLVIALANGDLATIDLSDSDTFENTNTSSSDDDSYDEDDDETTDSRVIETSDDMNSAGLTAIATDPDADSDIIYMIDRDSQSFYKYDLSSDDLSRIDLGDDDNESQDFTPTHIVFAESNSGDVLLITTTTGNVLVSSASEISFSSTTLSVRDDDQAEPNFAKAALTPDHNYAYILDTDNDLVWVYHFSSDSFIDQISAETSLDPIEFDSDEENSSLSDITLLEDESANTVYAYVSGSLGISIVDATNPNEKATSKLIDTDTTSSSVFDPISLSGSPSFVTSLSSDTLTFLAINGDATISVLSDNPFVTITSTSVSTLTETSSTFNLTFQADEAGTYTVVANSDPNQTTGTDLIDSTTLATADTSETTSVIDINDFDRDDFNEGENKIFVFVTDEDGNTGWDAAIITVDRPPEVIDITGVAFGNHKLFVNFELSADSDIASYTIFAEPASSASNPTCPGSLSFASTNTTSASVLASSCDATSCSGEITGLTNDIPYCVAIQVVDEVEQTSAIGAFTAAVSPEATVGPAEFLGESGCSLNEHNEISKTHFFILALILIPLFFRFSQKKIFKSLSLFFILIFLISSPSQAEELTKQQWTLEFKGTYWFPTRSEIKPFFAECCNLMGEIEFGWLPKKFYNITASAGFGYRSENAVGLSSGNTSGESFEMLLFPLRADFIFRYDVKEDQLFLPYLRVGADAFLFREYGANDDIWAVKFGGHAGVGFGILLDRIEPLDLFFEKELGVNDVYFTIEGRYAYLNSFSNTGMDFSGFYTSVGLLFQF